MATTHDIMTYKIGHMTYKIGHIPVTHKEAQSMLEPLLGSKSSEKVLIFIEVLGEGYAREISRFFGIALDPIQKQLDKLELGGILASLLKGRTRIYTFNPRYPFLKELKAMLDKALTFYPEEERERLLMNRRRPRRRGKTI
jgi:hypothetical protein